MTQSGAAELSGHASPTPPGATVVLHRQSLLALHVSFVPQSVPASPQRQPVPAMQSGVVPVHASPVGAVVPLQLQSPPAPVQVSLGPQSDAWHRQPVPVTQSGATELFTQASPMRLDVPLQSQFIEPLQLSFVPQSDAVSPQ